MVVDKLLTILHTSSDLSLVMENQDLQPIRKLAKEVVELLVKHLDNISESQITALDSLNNIEATSCKENLFKFSKIFNVLALTNNININGCEFLLKDAIDKDFDKFTQSMDNKCHVTFNDYMSCTKQHVTLTGEQDTASDYTL